MESINCPQCYCYAYDTLVRPGRVDMFENTISVPRIARSAHVLTSDFIRASTTPNDLSYIVTRCIEAGGVNRPKKGRRDAFSIMWLWIQTRIADLGNLNEIHFEHSPPKLLRIRIPKTDDGLYD
jgi:hypothetical protein